MGHGWAAAMPRMSTLLAMLALALAGVAAMDIYAEERQVQRAQAAADVGVEPVPEEFDDERRKLEAVEKLQEALGILVKVDGKDYIETPPQFMVELYNTVTDTGGYTTGKNPFDAEVVRSFAEKVTDDPTSKLYLFNPLGFKQNESIIEAELHVYRKRSLSALTHPSILSSPYYVIRVYQVLPDKSLDEPDLHRLLNVHYVGAYSSGWQVFNVKQAVLSWLSEESPNLGLLVAGTTIFGDQVKIEFVRRDEEPSGKQPLLVLFNDNNVGEPRSNHMRKDNEPQDTEEARKRNKRHWAGQPEVPEHVEASWPAHFHREKKHRSSERHRKNHGFVPKQRSLEQTIASMDIYERAMLREKLSARRKDAAEKRERRGRSGSGPARAKRESSAPAAGQSGLACRKPETEPCARRELYVNFRDIGMTSIIAPEGYAAYQCRGHCKSPLSQDQKPTNHATIQGIINTMNLAPEQDVREPCCVPVSLSSISILYHDEERDGVVLKSYTDMAIVSCGCR